MMNKEKIVSGKLYQKKRKRRNHLSLGLRKGNKISCPLDLKILMIWLMILLRPNLKRMQERKRDLRRRLEIIEPKTQFHQRKVNYQVLMTSYKEKLTNWKTNSRTSWMIKKTSVYIMKPRLQHFWTIWKIKILKKYKISKRTILRQRRNLNSK